MTAPDAFRLLLLAIIWGASFLLMRIAAPEFGPVPLILVRSVGAILCIVVWVWTRRRQDLMAAHLERMPDDPVPDKP